MGVADARRGVLRDVVPGVGGQACLGRRLAIDCLLRGGQACRGQCLGSPCSVPLLQGSLMLCILDVSRELRRVAEQRQRAYLALGEWRLQFCPAANDAPNAPLTVSEVWRFY